MGAGYSSFGNFIPFSTYKIESQVISDLTPTPHPTPTPTPVPAPTPHPTPTPEPPDLPLGVSYFSVDDVTIKEGLTGEFLVRGTGELKGEGYIYYRLTSSEGGSENKSIKIESGDQSVSIPVATRDDNKYGQNESYKIELTFVQIDGQADIADAFATMTMLDDDPKPNTGQAQFKVSGGNSVGSKKTIAMVAADPEGGKNFTHTWQQKAGGVWSDIEQGNTFVLKDAQENRQLRVVTT